MNVMFPCLKCNLTGNQYYRNWSRTVQIPDPGQLNQYSDLAYNLTDSTNWFRLPEKGRCIFFFATVSTSALVLTQPPLMGTGGYFHGTKAPGAWN